MKLINSLQQCVFSASLAAMQTISPQAWVCGGSVRDLIAGKISHDLDLVVADNALPIAARLAKCLNASLVIMNQDILPTARIVLSASSQIDLTQWRAASLEADLKARDFTMNALALPLATALQKPVLTRQDFIDPCGGYQHIEQKLICLAGPHSLADDALRIVRAFRFVAELGFSLDKSIDIQGALPGLQSIAKPRLGQEWLRLLQAANAGQGLEQMDSHGVLSYLLPGWEEGRGLTQNPCHHLPVLEHSLASVRAMEKVLQNPADYLPGLGDVLARLEVPTPLLKTACLLHDLGKPLTRRSKAPGWNSFHLHDQAGAKLALRAGQNLGLGRRQAATVANLVRRHMLPHFLLAAVTQYPDKRRRLLGRFVLRHNDVLHSLMFMALADDMAGLGPARPPDLEAKLLAVWQDVLAVQQTPQPAKPLLSGTELMAAFAMEPGPRLGTVLKRLRSRQLQGMIDSKEQALQLVRQWLGEDCEKVSKG